VGEQGDCWVRKLFYIFDIGNVLIDLDFPLLFRAIEETSRACYEEIISFFSKEAIFAVETGKVNSVDFFYHFSTSIDLRWSYDEWIRHLEEMYGINEVGFDLLQDLKDNGFSLCLLSNIAEYSILAIRNKFPGFFSICDYNFFSYELGYHKPQLEIFRSVCNTLACAPSDCIFIDDIERNVQSAQALGMRALLFSTQRVNTVVREIVRVAGVSLAMLKRTSVHMAKNEG
jgi:HAD superfamily hydrolase (TIGR01509 family)